MDRSPSKLLLLGSSRFRTFRNIWMLEELQVPFQHEFYKARPQSIGARQYHPLGKVPSLVVTEQDGSEWSMYESTAINTYLGDTYGALVPFPKTPDRVKYDQTVAFCLSELDAQGLWIHRKHESLGSSTIFGEAPQAVVEAKRQFHAANQVMMDQLSPFLLGNNFSAADILYVHCLDWAELIGWNQGNSTFENEKLVCYMQECRSRKGYKKAIARGQEETEFFKMVKRNEANNNTSKL